MPCNTIKLYKSGLARESLVFHLILLQKERKVYAVRGHDGSLCTQKQPEILLHPTQLDLLCELSTLTVHLVYCNQLIRGSCGYPDIADIKHPALVRHLTVASDSIVHV